MLLTFIVTVAILAVLYVLINICNKIIPRPDYDFSTGGDEVAADFCAYGIFDFFFGYGLGNNYIFFFE